MPKHPRRKAIPADEGQEIPGSKYVRAYCSVCGAAIRVPKGMSKYERQRTTCEGCFAPMESDQGILKIDRHHGSEGMRVAEAKKRDEQAQGNR